MPRYRVSQALFQRLVGSKPTYNNEVILQSSAQNSALAAQVSHFPRLVQQRAKTSVGTRRRGARRKRGPGRTTNMSRTRSGHDDHGAATGASSDAPPVFQHSASMPRLRQTGGAITGRGAGMVAPQRGASGGAVNKDAKEYASSDSDGAGTGGAAQTKPTVLPAWSQSPSGDAGPASPAALQAQVNTSGSPPARAARHGQDGGSSRRRRRRRQNASPDRRRRGSTHTDASSPLRRTLPRSPITPVKVGRQACRARRRTRAHVVASHVSQRHACCTTAEDGRGASARA